jgi:large subunit ribosomal protein L17
MRHRKEKNTLGLVDSHRKALLSNMMGSLIFHKRIKTTEAKAKALSREINKVINIARKDEQNGWRRVAERIRNKEALKELFNLIIPVYEDRESGFTRIIKGHPRKGDGAEMAYVELVGFEEEITEKERKRMEEKAMRRRIRKERDEEEMRRMEEEAAMEEGRREVDRESERDDEPDDKPGGLLKFFRRFKKKDRDPGS